MVILLSNSAKLSKSVVNLGVGCTEASIPHPQESYNFRAKEKFRDHPFQLPHFTEGETEAQRGYLIVHIVAEQVNGQARGRAHIF